MYNPYRIQLPLADTNYNLYDLITAEPNQAADMIIPDRAQHVILAADSDAAYMGALVYVGNYRLSAAEYGWIISIATYPLSVGPVRGNSICVRDFYLRTDTPGVYVLVNIQST